jgi:hypothetical protein
MWITMVFLISGLNLLYKFVAMLLLAFFLSMTMDHSTPKDPKVLGVS